MQFTGKIIHIGEVKSGISKNGKEWTSQSIVIENTDEKYPKSGVFDCFNQQLDFQIGDEVTVFFDLRAHEYQGRWFNSLSAFKVERISTEPISDRATGIRAIPREDKNVKSEPHLFDNEIKQDSNDDLPF